MLRVLVTWPTEKIISRLALVWGAVWLVGQVGRESSLPTALCFYLPSPVVGVALAILAALAFHRGRARRAGWICLGWLAPVLIVTLFVENRWWLSRSTPVAGRPLTLVHWNVMRGRLTPAVLLRRLQDEHADLYVLSEAPATVDVKYLADSLGPGHQAARFAGMAAVVRGEIVQLESLVQDSHLKITRLQCRVAGDVLDVFAVDIISNPLVNRRPLLRQLTKLIDEFHPAIVVGDFNTPRRARGLATLPNGYRHAYDAAGAGWSYTWPSVCPVLAIDQCIVGPTIEPLRYELTAAWGSDHRMQRLEFGRRQ